MNKTDVFYSSTLGMFGMLLGAGGSGFANDAGTNGTTVSAAAGNTNARFVQNCIHND
jgi:hypothetical protein